MVDVVVEGCDVLAVVVVLVEDVLAVVVVLVEGWDVPAVVVVLVEGCDVLAVVVVLVEDVLAVVVGEVGPRTGVFFLSVLSDKLLSNTSEDSDEPPHAEINVAAKRTEARTLTGAGFKGYLSIACRESFGARALAT